MSGGLTPDFALAYLRALSPDIRGAAILDVAGERLAGEQRLANRGRELLATAPAPPAADAEPALVRAPPERGEGLLLARSRRHAIVVRVATRALEPLIAYDMRAVLGSLGASS